MAYSFARPGFKGFRRPETISPEVLAFLKLRFEGDNRFVLYTGGAYSRRRASLRSNSLATVTEVREPVAILDFLTRAARAAGEDSGYDPATVLGGLALHAGAKPAVYLYLYREGDNFHAVKDIPNPDPSFSSRPFRAGDVVFTLPATEDTVEGADATLAAIEAATPSPSASSEVREVEVTEEASAAALAALAAAEGKGKARSRGGRRA
jgi:hypothetical protein